MKNIFTSALILCLSLMPLFQSVPYADAQSPTDTSHAYALGVSMGFASFQAVVGGYWQTREALTSARKSGNSLRTVVPQLNVALLDAPISQLGPDTDKFGLDVMNARLAKIASLLPTIRGEYSSVLRSSANPIGNAYDLGVAISLAEGQASRGEPARQLVKSGLTSAKVRATSLGFPESEVTGIIQQVDQGAPLNGIHSQITYLRNKYQVLLEGIAKPAPTGTKNTTKINTGGTPKSPDQVLLDAGCNRVPGKPGAYDCFTQRGFDSCNSYKAQGKATSCATKLDQRAQKKMDDELFSRGCRRFLGRPDQYLCTTQRGFAACEMYKNTGRATMCKLAKS